MAAVGTGAGLGFVSPVSAAGRAIAMSTGTKLLPILPSAWAVQQQVLF